MVRSKYLYCLKTLAVDYSLCDFCLKRNFPGLKNVKKHINNCFICRGLFNNISEIVKRIDYIVNIQKRYEYESFSIGTSLPYYIFDNEDLIRSLYEVKNLENIKSSFNHEVRKAFKSITKKKLNLAKPDIKIDIVISNNDEYSVKTSSRSFYLIGRYKKTKLLSQREKKGIENQNNSSSYIVSSKKQSIESIIQKTLSNSIESERMIFGWGGSEDDNSQVLGKGRFFYIHLLNPRQRKVKLKKTFHQNGLSFKILQRKDSLKYVNHNFRIKNKIFIKTANPINNFYLKKLTELNNTIVCYYYKSKIIKKKIYNIKFKKLDPLHLIIKLECESGLFIRQFIEGKNSIEPNLSIKLNNQCECLKFDILDISLL